MGQADGKECTGLTIHHFQPREKNRSVHFLSSPDSGPQRRRQSWMLNEAWWICLLAKTGGSMQLPQDKIEGLLIVLCRSISRR